MLQETAVSPALIFDRPVIVLGGGFVEEEMLLHLVAKGFPVIAADGAANVALAANVELAAIIGDMDSYQPVANLSEHTHIVKVAEQATTDFEKCLYKTSAPLYICLGMMGKRFDHSLAALHAAQKFGRDKNLILLDHTDVIAVVSGPISFSVPEGTRVSVYPLAPIRMDYSIGLKFPLNGLELAQGELIGTSNCANKNYIEIVPEHSAQQPYLLILPNTHLNTLLENEMRHVSASSF